MRDDRQRLAASMGRQTKMPENNPMHSSDVIDGMMVFRIASRRRAELTFDVMRIKQARVGMPEVVKREVTRHLVNGSAT
ncbi:hypothetical protein [Bradyrhizobium sp. RDT46]|uniref:hypothetical protein n=1 Tax=Bradyrhizobium sp. RDT46 TaxID=3341829 RepID=UPI0035C7386A